MSIAADTRGIFPVSPTPFLQDGKVDFNSIEKLVEFYKKSGAKGITILGLLGEAAKLDINESMETIKYFMKNKENLDVIVGVSSPGFAGVKFLAEAAMNMGASGVMVGPPPIIRTNEQIIEYFTSVAKFLGDDIPIIIQDYPLVNQVVFTPEVLKEIINRNPSCAAIKHEDWPGMDKLRILKKFMADGNMRKIPVFVGNGGLFVDMEYAVGVDGAMTGYPFPEMLVDTLGLIEKGKRHEAQDIYDLHLPYLRYEAQPRVGLAIRKYVLRLRGVVAYETQRKPMVSLSEGTKADVDYLLKRLVDKSGIQLKAI
jgi:4-hydroxy-tetrahydrodipicolinate synthase